MHVSKTLLIIALIVVPLSGAAAAAERPTPAAEGGRPAVGDPEAGGSVVFFPPSELFKAPLASPKEPRTHMTWLNLHIDAGSFNVGSVGFGESFGLVRWTGASADEGLQLGISGAVLAQFNLDSSSMDLINADYIIGFPLGYRRGAWSARARLFHQSSHLGDEFLLFPQPIGPVERINLSFETIELMAGYDWKALRLSAGGYYILHSDTPLERSAVQGGIDFLGPARWRLRVRPFASVFGHAWEETDWDIDLSAKAGLSMESPYGGKRAFQVYAQYFNGHLPFGQFYQERADFFGIGIGLRF